MRQARPPLTARGNPCVSALVARVAAAGAHCLHFCTLIQYRLLSISETATISKATLILNFQWFETISCAMSSRGAGRGARPPTPHPAPHQHTPAGAAVAGSREQKKMTLLRMQLLNLKSRQRRETLRVEKLPSCVLQKLPL
jgi:hypothetical protein